MLSIDWQSVKALFPIVPLLLLAHGALSAYWLKKNQEDVNVESRERTNTLRVKLLLVSQLEVLLLGDWIVMQGWWDRRWTGGLVASELSLVLATYIHHIAHRKLRAASTPLLLSYLLFIVFNIYNLSSIIRLLPYVEKPTVYLTLHIVFLSLILISFLILFYLECLGPSATNCRSVSDSKIRITDDGQEDIDSPLLEANIFSIMTFSWLTPLMKLGKSKFLDETDLWPLPPADHSDTLANRLRFFWEKQTLKKKPSLMLALVKAYGRDFFIAAIYKMLLAFVATWGTDNPAPAKNGYLIAVTMFVFAVAQTMCANQYFQGVMTTGMRNRAGLVGLVYSKSLVLSNEERIGKATGDIVNLMSSDCNRLQDFTQYSQIACFLAGIAILLLSMPANVVVARMNARFQKKQMKNKDQRTRIMSEILNNIRSIKLYAWEDSFTKKLFAVRNNKEMKVLRQIGLLNSTSVLLWQLTPFLVAFATFSIFASTSKTPLTADIVFPAIALFQLLAFPLAVLPQCISAMVEAWVSVVRLQNFFLGKELQKDAVEIVNSDRGSLKWGQPLIEVENGEFTWTSDPDRESTLVGIDLSVKKGQLVTIVGVVGSGKSSLLSALLGEMTKKEGKVTLRGKVAYCGQNAWLMSRSVKANIVFGCRWDPDFYETVLDACALRDDLAILPQGDMTEVGEKGITLSGGQKARVALARAVYARADIYLFDDPLSALDAHVGRHVFDKVMGPEGLLASKARLLCTNAIHYCQQSEEIVMLRKGVIIERGFYSDIITKDSDLARLLVEFGTKGENGGRSDDDDASSDTAITLDQPYDAGDADSPLPDMSKDRKLSQAIVRRASMISIRQQKRDTLRELKESTRPKENKETGNVKGRIYGIYVRASSVLGVFFFVFFIIASQSLSIATNFFLKSWAAHNSETGDNKTDLGYYLGIYLAIGLASVVCQFISSVSLSCWASIRSARKLHDSMFYSIMRAPMAFFETTPIGTILNRFSRDVQVLDEILSRVISGLIRTLANTLGVVVVIGYSVPVFLIAVLPLTYIYRQIQSYYLATSRELKRIDSTTKSPIFAMFQETLSGLPTIRAYRQQKRFIAENETRIDRNLQAYFANISANRWLSVRLEFLGSCIILFAATFLVLALERSHGALDAGMVGIVMSYALNTTQSLNWIVRSATEVETNIVSVERVQEYIELKPEAPLIVEGNRPAASWPEHGTVEFSKVKLRYREGLDFALKDASFKAEPGMKIGICGRTGAGKSTLTMALYRIVEPSSGRIFIDDIDILNIGLHDLRSKLSIIPQDSQCFEGSLRDNVDPTGQSSDDAIWQALEQARLKEHVQSMPGQLDATVNEGGSNLSAGQRQLLCLSRALLRSSKVLVLDEATSSVDPESDAAIQTVIRKEFANCTILVIAHRLNTIMDCDRILVMSAGQVAEFDSPKNLLEKKDSIFYSLAVEAGVVQSSSS